MPDFESILTPPQSFLESSFTTDFSLEATEELPAHTEKPTVPCVETPNGYRAFLKREDDMRSRDPLPGVRMAYDFAEQLGFRTVPHIIGEDYVVSEAYDGQPFSIRLDRIEDINADQIVTTYAKCLLMGFDDCGKSNLLVAPDGDFRFIDISSRHPAKVSYYTRMKAANVLESRFENPYVTDVVESRAASLAAYICENPESYPAALRSHADHIAAYFSPELRPPDSETTVDPWVDASTLIAEHYPPVDGYPRGVREPYIQPD